MLIHNLLRRLMAIVFILLAVCNLSANQQIDSLLSVGQPNKALKLIDAMERKALADGDNVEFFKALKYRIEAIRLTSNYSSNQATITDHFDSLLTIADLRIYKPLLYSIYADYTNNEKLKNALYELAVEHYEYPSTPMRLYDFLVENDDVGLVSRISLQQFIKLKAIDNQVADTLRNKLLKELQQDDYLRGYITADSLFRQALSIYESGVEVIKAADICKDIIRRYPDTKGALSAKDLMTTMYGKELSFRDIPLIIAANRQNIVKIVARNCNNINAQITGRESTGKTVSIKLQVIGDSLPAILPNDISLTIPPLKLGEYVFKIFVDSLPVKDTAVIRVSNLVYIREKIRENSRIVITDRVTGKPIKGAKISIKSYDSVLITDKRGFAIVPQSLQKLSSNGYSTPIVITYQKDTLNVSDYFSGRDYNSTERENIVYDIFTDRLTYRPGESVKYKIVARVGGANRWSVATDKSFVVQIKDADYNTITEQNLQTNRLGSVWGSFEIPIGLKNGYFTIKAGENSYKYINVIDFKLPTFEVKIDTDKEQYAVGDTIIFKGTARSYSGFPISNAQVKYAVDMKSYMPYMIGHSNDEDTEYQETMTDKDGNFNYSFVVEDKAYNKPRRPFPIQNVVITDAFVTDITGETQSTVRNVYIGKAEINVEDEQFDSTLNITTLDTICRVGSVARLKIQTNLKDAFLFYRATCKGNIIKEGDFKIDNGSTIIPILIDSTMRGGIWVTVFTVHNNQFHIRFANIEVPFDNKQLIITAKTIRDKVEPGSKETWTINVSLPDDKKLSTSQIRDCELVATMFDASLELFGEHRFRIHPYTPNHNQYSVSYYMSFGSEWINIFNDGSVYIDYPIFTPAYNFITPMFRTGLMAKNSYNRVMSESISAVADNAAVHNSGSGSMEPDYTKSFIPPRKNFANTAFFYPSVPIDSLGNATISFVMPDALTRWKFLAFAHSKDFKFGEFSTDIESMRQLMIIAHTPRFLRVGDSIDFAARATNLTDKPINAVAALLITNASTNDTIYYSTQNLNIGSHTNIPVKWSVCINQDISTIRYILSIESSVYHDAETNLIPVLANTVMLTQTQTIGKFDRNITVPTSNKTETATLEITTNPIWSVIYALPSITKGSREFVSSLVNDYIATAITANIINSNPQIVNIAEIMKAEGDPEFYATISDYNTAQFIMQHMLDQISDLQSQQGGWSWFKGMADNVFITSKVIESFDKLRKLRLGNDQIDRMITKGIEFIDRKENKIYDPVSYLYVKSITTNTRNRKIDSCLTAMRKEWKGLSIQEQAKLATAFYRFDDKRYADMLVTSFVDRVDSSCSISCLVAVYEAVKTVENNHPFLQKLITWIIENKQTTDWGSPVYTAEACFAILQHYANSDNSNKNTLLSLNPNLTVECDGRTVFNSTTDKSKAGIGYVSKTITTNHQPLFITRTPDSIDNKPLPDPIINLYYQYPEQMNSIKKHSNGISITKQLSDSNISLGDLVTVKLTFTLDREMSYIVITDQRSSALEPADQQSGYKCLGDVCAYVNIKDSQTQLFIPHLTAGTYSIEYRLKASQSGMFSDGFAEIQCQYAPYIKANTNSQAQLIITE